MVGSRKSHPYPTFSHQAKVGYRPDYWSGGVTTNLQELLYMTSSATHVLGKKRKETSSSESKTDSHPYNKRSKKETRSVVRLCE